MNDYGKIIHSKPCCPNHGEPLEGIPRPCPPKGTGKCPVSGVDFDFEINTQDLRTYKDKNGNIKTEPWFTVSGEEK